MGEFPGDTETERHLQIEGEEGGNIAIDHWHTGGSVRVNIEYDKGTTDYFVVDNQKVLEHWLPALRTDWREPIYREPDIENINERVGKGGVDVSRTEDGGLEIKPFFSTADNRAESSLKLGKAKSKELIQALTGNTSLKDKLFTFLK